ncbi:MAG: ABC transporter ATP-binding protein [Patescibacteria group bacterium]
MPSLMQTKSLKKEFVTGEVVTKVLHGIDLTIEKGEFVAIMGPSGSGKSTLMHIIGMLDTLTEGSYTFKGKDVTKLSDDELAHLRNQEIGFVFQAFFLLNKLSVLENVKLPLQYNAKKNKDAMARKALKAVGLSHRVDYFPNQVSGGEKQRVAIARALVNSPDIIFADEPTGNLDSKSGSQVMSILQRLNDEGRTVILVTHETYTSQHAKRIIYIKDGLIESDKPVTKRIIAKDDESLLK